MKPTFWVYINEPNDKAFVHLADCRFCKDGNGMSSAVSEQNGKWIGPFDQPTAIRAAISSNKKNKRWCAICAQKLDIPAKF